MTKQDRLEEWRRHKRSRNGIYRLSFGNALPGRSESFPRNSHSSISSLPPFERRCSNRQDDTEGDR